MERLEPVLLEAEPDVVLVPGDVNSTMAAALAAAKLAIPVGARRGRPALVRPDDARGDQPHRRRPGLAELLFIHSPEARDNLLARGLPAAARSTTSATR